MRTLLVGTALLAIMATPAMAQTDAELNDPAYWESYFPNTAHCVKHEAPSDTPHGYETAAGVILNPIDPAWGSYWTGLVIKAGTERTVVELPLPGVEYPSPDGKEVSHWIVCKASEPPITTTTTAPTTTTTVPPSTTSTSTTVPPPTTTTTVPPTTTTVTTVPPSTTSTTEPPTITTTTTTPPSTTTTETPNTTTTTDPPTTNTDPPPPTLPVTGPVEDLGLIALIGVGLLTTGLVTTATVRSRGVPHK